MHPHHDIVDSSLLFIRHHEGGLHATMISVSNLCITILILYLLLVYSSPFCDLDHMVSDISH